MEFLRYPQVIPALFSGRLVRSSMVFYHHFNLPMDRSPGFGSTSCNSFALFRLAFAPAPELLSLNLAAYRNSQVYSTKDTPLHITAVTSCQSMVSGSISLPSPGFFSPFPHGTSSLSVAVEYLALDRGRPGFRQGSSCPAVLRFRIRKSFTFRVRGFHTL